MPRGTGHFSLADILSNLGGYGSGEVEDDDVHDGFFSAMQGGFGHGGFGDSDDFEDDYDDNDSDDDDDDDDSDDDDDDDIAADEEDRPATLRKSTRLAKSNPRNTLSFRKSARSRLTPRRLFLLRERERAARDRRLRDSGRSQQRPHGTFHVMDVARKKSLPSINAVVPPRTKDIHRQLKSAKARAATEPAPDPSVLEPKLPADLKDELGAGGKLETVAGKSHSAFIAMPCRPAEQSASAAGSSISDNNSAAGQVSDAALLWLYEQSKTRAIASNPRLKRRVSQRGDHDDDDDDDETEDDRDDLGRSGKVGNGAPANDQKLPHRSKRRSSFEPERGLLESVIPKSPAEAFQWVLGSEMPSDTFFASIWEKKPFHYARGNDKHFAMLLTARDVNFAFETERLHYGRHVNVSYCYGGHENNMNPTDSGPVRAEDVWSQFNSGSCIQLKHPQRFAEGPYKLCSALESLFGCFVDSRAYFVPPKAEVYPAARAEAEMFVLQMEGSQTWTMFDLPDPSDESTDLGALDGEPSFSVDMHAGDSLYIPKGWVFRASENGPLTSAYVTVLTYGEHSWHDLIHATLYSALQKTLRERRAIRHGLPVNLFSYMSAAQSDQPEKKQAFQAQFQEHLSAVLGNVNVEEAVDRLSLDFFTRRLPPEQIAVPPKRDTNFSGVAPVSLDTRVRLLHPSYIRMSVDVDLANKPHLIVAHSLRNRRHLHLDEDAHLISDASFLKLPAHFAHAFSALLRTHPGYVPVGDFALDGDGEKLSLALDLWAHGVLEVHPDDAASEGPQPE